jgi:hypothetical protein
MNENRKRANQLLDKLKDGDQFSQHDIDTALRDAGDIASDGSEGIYQEIPQESDGGGESQGFGLVVAELGKVNQKTWSTRRR